MQLNDQVAAGLETPLRPGGRFVRRLPRRPAKQLTFRVPRIAFHAAFVTRLGIAKIELMRRPRAIDAEVRMMDDARIAGMKFERPDVSRLRGRDRDHERPKDISAIRPHAIRLRHRHDEIGLTETPTTAPRRHRRQRRPITFRCAVSNPALQHVELGVGQPPLVLKLAFTGFGFPRRHDPAAGDHLDLRQALLHVSVGQQTERADLAGAMAGRTTGPDDRCDVFREGGCRLRSSGRRDHQARGCDDCTNGSPGSRGLRGLQGQRCRHFPTRPSRSAVRDREHAGLA